MQNHEMTGRVKRTKKGTFDNRLSNAVISQIHKTSEFQGFYG
jgi:hypothetical protein